METIIFGNESPREISSTLMTKINTLKRSVPLPCPFWPTELPMPKVGKEAGMQARGLPQYCKEKMMVIEVKLF